MFYQKSVGTDHTFSLTVDSDTYKHDSDFYNLTKTHANDVICMVTFGASVSGINDMAYIYEVQ